jgi:3-dehydroquinate dehydratase
VVTPHAADVIAGHGIDGYREALEHLARAAGAAADGAAG